MSSMHLKWEAKAGKKWFARRYANEEQATKKMARILGEVRPVFQDAIADGTLFQRSKEEDEFMACFKADKNMDDGMGINFLSIIDAEGKSRSKEENLKILDDG